MVTYRLSSIECVLTHNNNVVAKSANPTPRGASAADAAAILTDLRVSRLLDLRSTDEWEPEPGPLQERFKLRPFSRDAADANLAFERAIEDDDSAGRLVRYHAPMIDYDRYNMYA